jgi:hypothetical protein
MSRGRQPIDDHLDTRFPFPLRRVRRSVKFFTLSACFSAAIRPARPGHTNCRPCFARRTQEPENGIMKTIVSLEHAINEFRQMLPAETATAKAIDRHEPWERIALNAVDDGYIEFANELGTFIEVCVRRSS